MEFLLPLLLYDLKRNWHLYKTQIFSPIKGPLYLSGRRALGTQHDINIEAATNKFGNVVFLHNSKYIYSMYMN